MSFKNPTPEYNFKHACQEGDLDLLKSLLREDVKYQHRASFEFQPLSEETIQEGFELACEWQRLSVVDYLLKFTNLETREEKFIMSCQACRLEQILLILPFVRNYAIHLGIFASCEYQNKEAINFFIDNDYVSLEEIFITLCMSYSVDLLQEFVMEVNEEILFLGFQEACSVYDKRDFPTKNETIDFLVGFAKKMGMDLRTDEFGPELTNVINEAYDLTIV